MVARVIDLATSKYTGFNFHHVRDLLDENQGIALSVSMVRRLLTGTGIKNLAKKRRLKKHRMRQRKTRSGEMVQIDASLYRWLGKGQPMVSLIGAIDDATGTISSWVLYLESRRISWAMSR